MNGENEKHSFCLNMEVKYDDQFLEDILVTALEGGSNYWIDHIEYIVESATKPKDVARSELAFQVIKDGGRVRVFYIDDSCEECGGRDENADNFGILTIKNLKLGVHKFVDESRMRTKDVLFDSELNLDAGNFDADMADCVLQFALFGEVVYG